MLTYEDACAKLGKRATKKLANNTYLHREDAHTLAVRLHATDVVLIHDDGSYTLDSGGWRTVTTKDRINQYGPVRVYQQQLEWYWMVGDVRHEFRNGVRIDGVTKLPLSAEEIVEREFLRAIKADEDGGAGVILTQPW